MRIFHDVGPVDCFADRRRKGEQRDHRVPGAPQRLADRRVAFAPNRLEGMVLRERRSARQIAFRSGMICLRSRFDTKAANCKSSERCRFAPWPVGTPCRLLRENPFSPPSTAIRTSLRPPVLSSLMTFSQNLRLRSARSKAREPPTRPRRRGPARHRRPCCALGLRRGF